MLNFRLKVEKFITEQLWQLLIVVAFVFGCAWIFDRYAQAIMFSVSHIIIRANFEKQYHCGKTSLCMFTTLSVAFFGIASTLDFSVSLLSTVPVCFIISFVGYLVQDRADLYLENKKIKAYLKKTPKDEILQKCTDLNYTDIKKQMAVKFFVENQKPKDVWTWLCQTQENPVEWDSVKKTKYRMKKDLFG